MPVRNSTATTAGHGTALLLLALLALAAALWLRPELAARLLAADSVELVLRDGSRLALLALAVMLALSGGTGELGTGAYAAGGALTAAALLALGGLPPVAAAGLGLAAATAMGTVTGAMIVATRRSSWLISGLLLLPFISILSILARSTDAAGTQGVLAVVLALGPLDLEIPPLPVALAAVLLLAALLPALLARTVLGNRLAALRAGLVTAERLGVRPLPVRLIQHGLVGLVAGLAGLLAPDPQPAGLALAAVGLSLAAVLAALVAMGGGPLSWQAALRALLACLLLAAAHQILAPVELAALAAVALLVLMLVNRPRPFHA